MIEKTVTINIEHGLHARPAGAIAKYCKNIEGDIYFTHKGTTISAKSPIKLMASGIKQGDKISIKVIAENEAEVLSSLSEFICTLK